MNLHKQIQDAGGLKSANDLSKDWGISKQRVGVLVKQEGFPEEIPGGVNGRPVWLGNEAREWRDNQINGRN